MLPALLLLGLFLQYNQPFAHAANPNIISFQGKVVNADGTNVTNGSYTFDFVMYDDPSAGSPSDGLHDKWHELSKSVTVTNGVFQTNLGSATALPDFNANPSLYLAVRFNNDAAGYMSPRVQMASVPYAKNADTVGGVSASNIVQLGATQSGNINISSGTIVSGLINGQNISSTANFTGTVTVQGVNSQAFRVQNVSSQTVFGVDSSANKILSGLPDGASAVGFTLNTTNAFATAGAKLLSIQNNGSEKFSVDKDGNLAVNGSTGTAVSCSSGQLLQTQVVVGGITTSGTCSTLTTTGILNSGSISTGFGAIDVGTDAITTTGIIGTAGVTTFTGSTGTFSGALAANGGITFDSSADTIGAFTLGGNEDANNNLLLNIGNGGTDFTAGGGLTLASSFLANGDSTLGDAATDGLTFTGEIRGATPLMFEGLTNNDVRTSFAFVDPSTNRTITFPDSTGTVLVHSNISGDATVTSGGALTVANSAITNAKLANSSVSLALGTGGSDINWQATTVNLGGTATLNLPDAGSSARGLVTTGTQTFAGDKTFTGTINLPGGGAISNFTCCGASTWINLPTTGASGIGSGGAGSNAWIAYAPTNGSWFTDSLAGDIVYRNTAGRLLFGNSAGNSSAIISSTGLTLRSTSTTAFDVQNASSVDVFSVDSTNNRVIVGPVAGAATPTLLVVGIGTSAGDPTGTNGAIYYNSSMGDFRCYENGAWRNCLGALSVIKTADQAVTNSAALTDATDLSFPLAANGYYTFTAVIAFNAPSVTADIRWSFSAATATAINVAGEAPLATGSAVTTSTCNLITSNANCDVATTAGGRGVMRISGFVQNGASAGTVQFRFAQRVATAGQSVTIYKGSTMSYQLVQ